MPEMKSFAWRKKNVCHNIFLSTVLLVTLLFWLIPVQEAVARTPGPRNPETSGELIVKYHSDAGQSEINKSLKGFSAQMIENDDQPELQLLRLEKDASLDEAMAQLEKNENVAYVEPNYIYRICDDENPEDLYTGFQWGLEAVDAWDAWEELRNISGSGVTVAVVDTGVDYLHPDLAANVNTTNDKDFVNGNAEGDDTDGAMDDNGHGTHVAGIIGAVSGNHLGITGVAGTFPVTILPIKVLNEDGEGTVFDVARGIRKAADQGAEVINLSLGGPGYSQTLAEAVAYAQKKGCLVVAAAGNKSDVVDYYYPAALPGVLTVGAVAEDGEGGFTQAYFSNYGQALDVVAPGVHILSTVPEFVYGMKDVELLGDKGPEGCYAYFSGTSMAAPFVSGVAALVKMAYPDENAGEIAARLQKTARDLGEDGWDPDYGYGLIQAESALEDSDLLKPETIVFVNPAEGSTLWGEIQLQTQVAYPDQVGAVKFYLNEKDEDHLLGRVNREDADQLFYNFLWDTTKAAGGGSLADDFYTLIAQAVDQGEKTLDEDCRSVQVKNQITSGLQFEVVNPDGLPAQGAEVTIWYQNKELADGQQTSNGANGEQEYLYEKVYRGWTDINGLLRVPGSWATDLNSYYVLVFSGQEDAEGNLAPVFYFRQLESPQKMLINGSQAKEVNLQAQIFQATGEGTQPMEGGEIWAYCQDDQGISLNIPEYMGSLDNQGLLKAWMDPGFYGFYALDDQNGYYLKQEVQVWDLTLGEKLTVNFNLTNTARVKIDLKDPADWAQFYLFDDYFASQLGMTVLDNQEIIVTAGNYLPGFDLFVEQEGTSGSETWLYRLDAEDWVNFDQGVHQIAVGGNIQLSWVLPQTQFVPGDYLEGDVTCQDSNGLILWEMEKYGEDIFGEEKGSISCRSSYKAPEQKKIACWNEKTKDWDTGYPAGDPVAVYPVWQVERTADHKLIAENEFPFYGGFFYYLDPENPDLVSGSYRGILSLDAGPLGSPQESRDFYLGTSAGNVVLEITGPDGNPASWVKVSVYVWTEAGDWEEVFYDGKDEDGILYLSHGLGIDSDDPVLITAASLEEEEAFFLFQEMTGLVGPRILLDGTRTRQVEIKAVSSQGGGLDQMDVFSTIFFPEANGEYWVLTNYLGQTGTDGVLKVWLDPRFYSIAGSKNSTGASYYLNAPWTEILSGTGTFQVRLDGSNTGEITPQLTGKISSLVLVPVNELVPYSPLIELNPGDKLYLSASTYWMAAIPFREDPDGLWDYIEEISGWDWAGEGQAISRGNKKNLYFGSNFDLSLSLNNNQLNQRDLLKGNVIIRDEYGNRVIGVEVDPYWYEEEFVFLSLSPEGKLLVQNDRDKIKMDSYDEIAPFLSIYRGEERIYHEKNEEYYLAADYQIPSDAVVDSYSARMALQIGPDGVIQDEKTFAVIAGGGSSGGGGSGGGGGGGGGGSDDEPDAMEKKEVEKYFLDHPGTEALTIDVKEDKNPEFAITLDSLNYLEDKRKDLVISGEKLMIENLLAALDSDKIVDLAETDQDVEIKIEIKQQSGSGAGRLTLSDGMHFVAGLDFKISVLVKGKAKGTVSTFRSPVKVSLQLTPEQLQGCNVDLLGVYYYNETAGKAEYVGGTYDGASGKISFVTPHWSKFLVLEYKKSFTDFPAGHWAQNEVQMMVARHIITGLTETTFGPDQNITRAEFAALLVRAMHLETDSRKDGIFRDVPEDAWFADYISAAYQAGLIRGSSADTFSPYNTITREEMAVMIVRALEYLEKMPEDQENDNKEVLKNFQDGYQVSHWARDAMGFMVTSGMMDGRTADTLEPGSRASRAESAVILKRFMQDAGLL